jgi:hypothetical protein
MDKNASWSMKEFQQALRMKRRGVACADIALALGRRTASVEAKLSFCDRKWAAEPTGTLPRRVAIKGRAPNEAHVPDL